jgi:hypothetical protein
MLFYASLILLATMAAGQAPTSASASLDEAGALQYTVRFDFDPKPFEKPPVLAAPYSAEEHLKTTSAEAAQDVVSRILYRDSRGRERVERALYLGPSSIREPIRLIEITDWVEGCHYTLDPQNKIAHRIIRPVQVQGAISPISVAPPPPSSALATAVATMDPHGMVQVSDASPARPQTAPSPDRTAPVTAHLPPDQLDRLTPAADALGTKEIDGLKVTGEGFTRTLADDTIHWENWKSPELGVTILSTVSDRRSGERTIELKNVRRTEPDATLFQVPSDYAIQNERGPFSITFAVKQ